MAKNIVIDVKVNGLGAIEKQLKGVTNEIDNIKNSDIIDSKKLKAAETAAISFKKEIADANTELANVGEKAAVGVKDLKTQLREATKELNLLAASEVVDPVAMQNAVAKVGQLKDRMSDVREQVGVMAGGSDFEKMAGGFGLIGDQLSNMDFEGATQNTRNLATTMKTMNPAAMAGQLKELGGAVLKLGAQFVKMGIQLLMNPLLWIPAAIAAVIAIIVLLKDKVDILGKAFDMMMVPINYLIQKLKDLGDMLGLTTFASDEASAKIVSNSEKTTKAIEKSGNRQTEAIDAEISMRKAAGQDTEDLEIKKQNAILATARTQFIAAQTVIDSLMSQMKLHGKLTEEQTKELEKQKENLDNFSKQMRGAKQELVNISISSDKKINDEADKSNEDRLAKQKEADAKRIKLKEDMARAELDALRRTNDLIDSLIVDQQERETAQLKRKTEREIEEVTKNELLKADTKAKLIEQIVNDSKSKQKKIDDDELKRQMDQYEKERLAWVKFNDELLALKNINKANMDSVLLSENEKEVKAINDKYDDMLNASRDYYKKEIEAAKGNALIIAGLKALQAGDEAAIEVKRKEDKEKQNVDKKLKEIADVEETYNNVVQATQAGIDLLNSLDANRINKINETHQQELSELDSKQQAEIAASGGSEEEKAAIDAKYAELRYQSDLKATKKLNEIKKKQFIIDKAFKLATAVGETGLAIAKANALGFPASIPAMIFAASTGALQIAAIAATKFQGDAGPSAPSTPGFSAGAGGGSTQPTTPTMKDSLEKKNDLNNITSEKTQELPQFTVKAIISETEVTDTQNKVSKMRTNAEL